ncbi:MAG: DUF84 family protein [Candidatus Heimdallarchaeota archaeon]|nr:DUF84 family protein [Candidatus Heimdallarchaeota archaeon]MCK4955220.1 DUF84 family protein [Candidatus Heimdallarchaeota archaeon]
MMKIVVCSENPVKIQAVKEAFSLYFSDFSIKKLGLKEHKTVSKQPLSGNQTLESAIKRVEIAREIKTGNYYVSLEGGVSKDQYGAFLTWFVCIINESGKKSIAGGGRMPLPLVLYEKLSEDKRKELGDIIDELTSDVNTKQKGGASALFTGGEVLRKDVFKRDIIMALIPFTSPIFQNLEG